MRLKSLICLMYSLIFLVFQVIPVRRSFAFDTTTRPATSKITPSSVHLRKSAPRSRITSPARSTAKCSCALKLLTWVVRRHQPFAIVEDPELLEIFQMLYARVDVPSARTISRNVQEVFELSKHNLVSMLKVRVLYIYLYHL